MYLVNCIIGQQIPHNKSVIFLNLLSTCQSQDIVAYGLYLVVAICKCAAIVGVQGHLWHISGRYFCSVDDYISDLKGH